MQARKVVLKFITLEAERSRIDTAKVSIARPAFICNLEMMLALDAGDKFITVAGPGELLVIGGVPTIEGAAQVKRSACQGCNGTIPWSGCLLRLRGGLRQQQGKPTGKPGVLHALSLSHRQPSSQRRSTFAPPERPV